MSIKANILITIIDERITFLIAVICNLIGYIIVYYGEDKRVLANVRNFMANYVGACEVSLRRPGHQQHDEQHGHGENRHRRHGKDRRKLCKVYTRRDYIHQS